MRRVGICGLAIVIIFSLVLPSHAFFNSDVKKAKEFIKADMYPQAIELLDKRINEKPTDADAHYLLGSCYLQQGNIDMAEQRFDSAVKLNTKYGSKVATEFQNAGNTSLDAGNFSRAQHLYREAIKHNPALQAQIAKMCFDVGSASLSKPHLEMAIRINSSYKMKAYNHIMDNADAASDEACLKLYKMAAQYCGKKCERTLKAGKRLEQIANIIQKKNILDERIEPILALAKKLNENVRSYVTTLSKGDHAVSPGGNLDGLWLKPVPGKIDFYPTDGAEYNILLRNGKKYFMGRNMPKVINEPFMIELINKKAMIVGIQ